jgi:hypothetical protein
MAQPAKKNYGEPANGTRSLLSGNNFDFGYGDYGKVQQQINDMYNKQKTAKISEYTNARNKAVGQLNQQKKEIMPTFQAKRNETDVINRQNVQALRESMAANGLLSSGENVTAQVGLGAARQNSLNDINMEQQTTERDFARRLADINDPGEQNRMLQEIEALRTQSLMEAYNRQQQLAYQKKMDDMAEAWRKKEWEYRLKQDAEAKARAAAASRSRGGGSYSSSSAPKPALAKPLNQSDLYWAVQQQVDKMKKTASPKTAAVAPHLGSTAYFNKMKGLMG